MTKFAIYTKWHWPDGLNSSKELQNGMKENLLGKTKAEDVIWWKVDDNHHQSVIIFPSEEIATEELEKRKAFRKKATEANNTKMVEEVVGPVLAQLSLL